MNDSDSTAARCRPTRTTARSDERADLVTLGGRSPHFRVMCGQDLRGVVRGGALQMRNTNHLVRTFPGADVSRPASTSRPASSDGDAPATAPAHGHRARRADQERMLQRAAKMLTSALPVEGHRRARPGDGRRADHGERGAVPQITASPLALRLTCRVLGRAVKIDLKVPSSIAAPVKKADHRRGVVTVAASRSVGRRVAPAMSPARRGASWF